MRTGLGLGTNTKQGSWADAETGEGQENETETEIVDWTEAKVLPEITAELNVWIDTLGV